MVSFAKRSDVLPICVEGPENSTLTQERGPKLKSVLVCSNQKGNMENYNLL